MDDRYLFRAKRTDNGKWIVGFYHWINWRDPHTGDIVEVTHNVLPIDYQDSYRVDPSTICQCTGLPDKNSRKIFELDIIKSDSDIGIVKFGRYQNHFHFGFYVDWISCPHLRSELGFWNERSSVVGNIFDNPELLKERK